MKVNKGGRSDRYDPGPLHPKYPEGEERMTKFPNTLDRIQVHTYPTYEELEKIDNMCESIGVSRSQFFIIAAMTFKSSCVQCERLLNKIKGVTNGTVRRKEGQKAKAPINY